MTNIFSVAGEHYSLESITEDYGDDNPTVDQIENTEAYKPLLDDSVDPTLQYQRIDAITENLIASKRLNEITQTERPMEVASVVSQIALESDTGFSLAKVKEFFLNLLRSLVALGRTIWNNIRRQYKHFMASLAGLIRNLTYMDKLFKELAGVVSGDYTTTADIVFGSELRYLSSDDQTINLTTLPMELNRLLDMIGGIKDKVLPALSEISSHVVRVIVEQGESNDPIMLLDTIQNSLGKATADEKINLLQYPVDDYHPLLMLKPYLGPLTKSRSPFIQGSALASESFLGGVQLFFKERNLPEKEKKSNNPTVILFNRVRAYQELSVMFRRPGGVESHPPRIESTQTINTDPRVMSSIIGLAQRINKEFAEVTKDRNISLVENQAKLIENNLQNMSLVLQDPEYSADSLEALKVLTGYVQFMNNTSIFPFQDLSILITNVTNAVGVMGRKVLATYEVK